MIDLERFQRQVEAFNLWKLNGCIGSIIAATGFGKTKIGELAIKYFRDSPNFSAIVAVPSEYLKNAWRELIDELGIQNVYVDTVHMIIKGQHKAQLLVLDELHTYTSNEFSNVFECVQYSHMLGLTATLRTNEEENQILYDKCPIVDRIPLKLCLEKGWVSPFFVYNLAIKLTYSEQQQYDKLNRLFIKYFSTFDQDWDIAMSCLGKGGKYNVDKIARALQWKPEIVQIHAVQFMRTVQRRKKFLYDIPSLVNTTVELIKEFPERKVIVFSESTAFADKVVAQIPKEAVAYHSNLTSQIINGKKYGKKRLRDMALKGFDDDTYRVLSTAKALNQGYNVKNADMGILASFNSSQLDSIQRTGRVIRKVDGKIAIEINLYVPGTQGEKWLKEKQKQTPNIIWVQSIKDIKEHVTGFNP